MKYEDLFGVPRSAAGLLPWPWHTDKIFPTV